MPPWLLMYATAACVPRTAPSKMPGTGPVSVETLPMVIESAVTPTSVAPPLPPAGAAAAGLRAAPLPLPPAAAPVAVPDDVPGRPPAPASVTSAADPAPVSPADPAPPTLVR